jgi:hypothetical protein
MCNFIVITAENSLVNVSGDIEMFIVKILMHFIHILCKSSGTGHITYFDFIHFRVSYCEHGSRQSDCMCHNPMENNTICLTY